MGAIDTVFTGMLVVGPLVCVGFAHDAANHSIAIASPAGFTVDYPSSWSSGPPEPTTGNISIANFGTGHGAEGVVIGRDEAIITVFTAPAPAASLHDFVRKQMRGDTSVAIRKVHLRPVYRDGCTDAFRSDSLNAVGPSVYEQVTAYYCALNGRLIAVELVNRRDDRNLPTYRRLLLKVAESLRLPSNGRGRR